MICNATAADVMEANVITISPDSSLKEAWEILSNNRISGAPVVSESDGLVGVISQSDVLQQVVLDDQIGRPGNSYYIGDPYWENELLEDTIDKLQHTRVDEAMSPSAITVSPEDAVSTVAVLMRTNHIHRVIVTNEKKVVGIITALGLLKVLEQH